MAQVTLGERSLDRRLAREQPIEGGVEFVLIDVAEAECFAQAGRGGRWRERTSGGEFRGGIKDLADDQGKHQIAAAIVVGPEQTVEADLAGGAQGCGDVTVRQSAGHGEGVALGRDDGAAPEHAAQPFDGGLGPVGQIA